MFKEKAHNEIIIFSIFVFEICFLRIMLNLTYRHLKARAIKAVAKTIGVALLVYVCIETSEVYHKQRYDVTALIAGKIVVSQSTTLTQCA